MFTGSQMLALIFGNFYLVPPALLQWITLCLGCAPLGFVNLKITFSDFFCKYLPEQNNDVFLGKIHVLDVQWKSNTRNHFRISLMIVHSEAEKHFFRFVFNLFNPTPNLWIIPACKELHCVWGFVQLLGFQNWGCLEES